MKRFATILAGLAVALGATSLESAALNLDGTWEGKITCKGLDEPGEKDKFTRSGELLIQQTGDTFNLSANGEFFAGVVLASASNPDKGMATFIGCGTTAELPTLSQMVSARVSVNPDTEAGTLSGEGPYLVGDAQYLCKWDFKRTRPLLLTFGCAR